MEWPEVFKTGNALHNDKAKAIADALMGWGMCETGVATLPENFGKGIVALQKIVGEPLTPNTIMDVADRWKKENPK